MHIVMPWARIGEGVAQYRRKVLSANPTTSASTVLIGLPAGWQGSIPLSGEEEWEWIVIEGDTRVGGNEAGALTYGSRPPGSADAAIEGSVAGAKLLLWCGF